jgi:hypothetical protein
MGPIEMNLGFTELAAIGGIVSAVTVVSGALVKVLTVWIVSKMPAARAEEASGIQCKLEHSQLQSILVSQNASIAKMLEQNGKQIEALREINHSTQLRHEIVLAKLNSIEREVTRAR